MVRRLLLSVLVTLLAVSLVEGQVRVARHAQLDSPIHYLPSPGGDPSLVINSAAHLGASPLGICDAEDVLYVVDLVTGNTYTYDLTLANTGTLPSPGGTNQMTGIAYDGTDLFWVDTDAVVLFQTDLAGTIIDSFPYASPGGGLIAGLTFDDVAGTLWGDDIDTDEYFESDLSGVLTGNTFPNPRVGGATALGNGIAHIPGTDCFDIPTGPPGGGTQVDELVRVDRFGGELFAASVLFVPDTFINGNEWHADGSGAGLGPVNYLVGNATNVLFEIDTFDDCTACASVTLTCTNDNDDGNLTWVNNGCLANPCPYTGHEIFRNGSSIATLPAGDTSYTDVAPGDGTHTYSVVTTCDNGGSGNVSCVVIIGQASDLIWDGSASGDSGGSRTAIEAALTNSGRSFDSVSDLSALDLSVYETVWAIAGAYPDNTIISAAEGDLLADYCLSGGPTGKRAALYLEGTDTFAFDTPTAVHDLDHTIGVSDGDATGVAIVTGLAAVDASGNALCDLSFIVDVPYIEPTNEWVDYVVPDTTPTGNGAAVSLISDLGQNLGVFGDANLSGVGNGVHVTATSSVSGGSLDGVQADYFAAIISCLSPPPMEEVIRGDINNDGVVNFLVDALFALNAGFVPGSPQPSCQTQADANGDRTVNFLVDALFMLNAGFVPGSPLPPAPYPDCGDDANGIDTLGCDVPNPAC